MKDRALAALLLLAAGNAAAEAHRLDVRLTSGRSVFTQALRAEEGRSVNYSGRVAGTGGAVRSLIVNTNLGVNPWSLDYQIELTGGQGSSLPSLQAQGSVLLRPGARVVALDCGAWTVEFALDAGPRKTAKPAPQWDGGGLGNDRVSLELANGRKPLKCRYLAREGAQTNIFDGQVIGGRRSGFIFNSVFNANRGAFVLEYQLEDSRPGLSRVQLQNQANLTSGRKTSVPGSGYQLDFLVESAAPSAAAPTAAPPAPAAPAETAPLLR